MILKVGTDIVSLERIRGVMEHEGFVKRILAKAEIREPLTEEYVAGRWAAKEAVIKCLGGNPIDHVILNREDGSPYLSSSVPEGCVVHLSISHEREYAVAVAIVEKC